MASTPEDERGPLPGNPAGALWNAERVDLLSALRKVHPTVGDLYAATVAALCQEPLTMAGLLIASHGVREIAAALPVALADVDGLPPRKDLQQAAHRLRSAWEDHPDQLSPCDVPIPVRPSAPTEPVDVLTVPAAVLEAARAVVEADTIGSVNNDLKRSALVLGRLDAGDVTVRIFQRHVNFFMGYAHAAGVLDRAAPPRDDVVVHLAAIESVLRARLKRFFETAAEIADLLDAANRRVEPT